MYNIYCRMTTDSTFRLLLTDAVVEHAEGNNTEQVITYSARFSSKAKLALWQIENILGFYSQVENVDILLHSLSSDTIIIIPSASLVGFKIDSSDLTINISIKEKI